MSYFLYSFLKHGIIFAVYNLKSNFFIPTGGSLKNAHKTDKTHFLCGYTNSGKTTIGKELARQLDVPFTIQTNWSPPRQDRLHNRSSPLKQRSLPQYWTWDHQTGIQLSPLRNFHRWRSAHLLPQRRSSLQSRYHYLLKPPLWRLLQKPDAKSWPASYQKQHQRRTSWPIQQAGSLLWGLRSIYSKKWPHPTGNCPSYHWTTFLKTS